MIPRIHIYALIFFMCINKTMCPVQISKGCSSRWIKCAPLSLEDREQIKYICSELEKEYTLNNVSAPCSFNVNKGANKVECQIAYVGLMSPKLYALKITYSNNQNQGFGNNEGIYPIDKALPHIKHWLEHGTTKLNENRESVFPLNTEANSLECSTESPEPTSCVDRMRQSLCSIQ